MLLALREEHEFDITTQQREQLTILSRNYTIILCV